MKHCHTIDLLKARWPFFPLIGFGISLFLVGCIRCPDGPDPDVKIQLEPWQKEIFPYKNLKSLKWKISLKNKEDEIVTFKRTRFVSGYTYGRNAGQECVTYGYLSQFFKAVYQDSLGSRKLEFAITDNDESVYSGMKEGLHIHFSDAYVDSYAIIYLHDVSALTESLNNLDTIATHAYNLFDEFADGINVEYNAKYGFVKATRNKEIWQLIDAE